MHSKVTEIPIFSIYKYFWNKNCFPCFVDFLQVEQMDFLLHSWHETGSVNRDKAEIIGILIFKYQNCVYLTIVERSTSVRTNSSSANFIIPTSSPVWCKVIIFSALICCLVGILFLFSLVLQQAFFSSWLTYFSNWQFRQFHAALQWPLETKVVHKNKVLFE